MIPEIDQLERTLWNAAWNGEIDMINKQINRGFDIDHQYHFANGRYEPRSTASEDSWMIHTGDLNGSTLLHIACFRGHVDLASFLISRGADKSLRNALGRRPVDMLRAPLSTCASDQIASLEFLLA